MHVKIRFVIVLFREWFLYPIHTGSWD